MASPELAEGAVVGGRYRLQRRLSGDEHQGVLWLAGDSLAADAPVALREIGPGLHQERARQLWERLQGVLHPQVPRIGAAISEDDRLWLVRDWQVGRTYAELLEARRERQLVFGAGEVLLLLRQILPVLAALHAQDLLHGDLTPANLLRRDSDGLPVLLDFGLLRGTSAAGEDGDGERRGATPGYAPPELVRGEPAEPWMDLHALGVMALVLISGDEPGQLLDPVSMAWRWPAALESEPALRAQLQRLVEADPSRRFAAASQALASFQELEMPDSTGPVPRADRTVMLVPPPASPEETAAAERPEPPADASSGDGGGDARAPAADAAVAQAPLPPARLRHLEKEEAAEGGLGPILAALLVSALVGITLGWWWLGRERAVEPLPRLPEEVSGSLPPAEVSQRQQLLNRLRAMQVDRGWFLSLVDASLLAQYPERKGRLPGESLEDAPLRRVWNEIAEEWAVRVEQLPLEIRRRLGSFSGADWDRRQAELVRQGLSPEVLQELVSSSARNLLAGRASGGEMPAEPFRQLWFAAAEMTLANMRIEPIEVRSGVAQVMSADVPASGARLFPIKVPADHGLVLGVTGTPLLQMSVYGAEGGQLAPLGGLRVVTLGAQKSSPLQLLVSNNGVAPARISLSLRADPPPPAPEPEPSPPPPGRSEPAPVWGPESLRRGPAAPGAAGQDEPPPSESAVPPPRSAAPAAGEAEGDGDLPAEQP